MAQLYSCWETADCGEFEDCEDPGNTSASNDDRFIWKRCVDCHDTFPVSKETGRVVSFVIY